MLIGAAIILLFFSCWQFLRARKAQILLNEAKTQLYMREHKIATILNNAPIVFSAIDTAGIFHTSEGKGLQRLGRKDNQSVGASIYEMHNHNPVILTAVAKALAGELVSTSFELNGVAYDLFMGPERNAHGKIIGASMLSVDISDRKEIEEEKSQLQIREQTAIATSKLKSEFLATMSHEIRTPINGVIGMTSLLLKTNLDAKQKEFAEAIQISGSGLLTVINDILDFSKIEAGKLQFEEIDFELPEFFRHSIKGLAFTASEKGIGLSINVDPKIPVWVRGDPGRFRQILNNLISNAIKFTTKGQVTVSVAPEPATKKSPCGVRITVEDTGIGIAKDVVPALFTSFTQAEASMSRRFGGTGLGLSICKQLVDRMGGEIGATSVEGRGSVFWFTIPFAAGHELVVNAPAGGSTAIVSPTSPRILLAEDNKINQMIAIAMLDEMGCTVDVTKDGVEALSALEKTDYDLVLMDCQMPVMDGLEATRRFRAKVSGRNSGIPILAMTANAMSGDKEKCLNAGMDDYVSKPIAFEALKSVIVRWLTIHQQRKAG